MGLYNFQPQFVPKILSGEKRHTIRADRKDGRVPKPGEILHLYTGLRHRGALLLMRVPCTKVERIKIEGGLVSTYSARPLYIHIDDNLLSLDESEQLARSDGFASLLDMMVFWQGRTPFNGNIIHWRFQAKDATWEPKGNGVQKTMPTHGVYEPDRS
jgi:hypothetical protein